ncbi:hypothetical protein [Rufibacter psychrotolerans]|uniref:hypothetical protein n=1 Tax=Rufibacter psychrotolerans TaxID=2812556 RepID=UPI001967D214|nr:hypothetical protein [Rufibacter sp. SYSU D00308]
MKKLLSLFILALFVLFAFRMKGDLRAKEVSTAFLSLVGQMNPSLPPLQAYEKYVSGLDSSNVTHVSKAAEKYASLFKAQRPALADSGYAVFEGFYQRVNTALTRLHGENAAHSNLLAQVHGEANPAQPTPTQKDFQQTMLANGFEVHLREGGTYLKQNRDSIARHFYPFISPVLREYLEQVNKETKEGFADDTGLTIIEEAFVDRVVWWESFVARNPTFLYAKESAERKKYYLTVLLAGLDNTPVLTYERKKLDTYFAVAYRELHRCAPASEANKLVQPYFKALVRSDKLRANALLQQYRKAGAILGSSAPGS